MAVLERRHDNVEVHGGVQESGFNIMASAEAFEILSDRIYPNKIKAVVRELSTNAVDATIDARKVAKVHKLIRDIGASPDEIANVVGDNLDYVGREMRVYGENAGKYNLSDWQEKPPVVHLPNRLEPWFSIRDFGTGLSHEFVMKLYTTYFWSDKKTSNDYTGCLGLGSKSPFAYTDHFTVTSYWNGEKRSYNAHLTNGFPAITIFTNDDGTELVDPTDEPNGIEVSFGVKSSDFVEFQREAKQLYPYFNMPLTIIGSSDVRDYIEKVHKQKKEGNYYKIRNEGDTFHWGIRTDDGYTYGARAIMGNIAYPIQLSDVSGLEYRHLQLLKLNIDIIFPVGALQITPSRESLSYKPSTIKAIKDVVLTIPDAIIKQISVGLNDQKTLWDARVFARRLISGGEFSFIFGSGENPDMMWNGQKLTNIQHVSFDDKKFPDMTIHKFAQHQRKRAEVHTLPCVDGLKIFEIDIPRGSFSRCELEAGKHGETFAIEFRIPQARIDFLNHLGMDHSVQFPGTSTLPKPEASQRTSYGSTGQVFIFTPSYGRRAERSYSHWESAPATFDLNDGGVYVEMMRHNVIHPDGHQVHPSSIGNIVDYLGALGHSVKVIGVRNKLVKKFRQSDDWVDLFTYARKVIEQDNLKHGISEIIVNKNALRDFKREYDRLDSLLEQKDSVSDGNFKQFLSALSAVKESSEKVGDNIGAYTALANVINFKFEDKPAGDLRASFQQVLQQYPLLGYVMNANFYSPYHEDNEALTHFLKYVEAVDKSLLS